MVGFVAGVEMEFVVGFEFVEEAFGESEVYLGVLVVQEDNFGCLTMTRGITAW